MCQSDAGHRVPPLLDRCDSLYDNAENSDVKFHVGRDPDTWLINGHRSVLSAANPVFRAQFEGSLPPSDGEVIIIPDADPRAFDYFLRHLYHKHFQFQSIQTALNTLFVANRYLCPELIEVCVKYLDGQLSTANVLDMYCSVKPLACDISQHHVPSAPYEDTLPMDSELAALVPSNNNNGEDTPLTYWPNALVHNCLQFIDEHAEQVLAHEDIEDLEKDSLQQIVERDTLKLDSEVPVFLAMERWSNRACKRRKLCCSAEDRREVLGELLDCVRIGTFTAQEFVLHVIPSGLFTQSQLSSFSAVISGSGQLGVYPDKFSEKRVFIRNDSIALSARSQVIDTNQQSLSRNGSAEKNKKKIGKEKTRAKSIDSTKSDKCSRCCCLEYVVEIISCIFD